MDLAMDGRHPRQEVAETCSRDAKKATVDRGEPSGLRHFGVSCPVCIVLEQAVPFASFDVCIMHGNWVSQTRGLKFMSKSVSV